MRLQLESKNLACMRLTVMDTVRPEDALVLRAGFKNLLNKARTAFLMDISQTTIPPDAEFAVLANQVDAVTHKMRLIIIGSNAKICQAKTPKEAETLLSSVMRLDKVLLPQLYELQKHYYARSDKAIGLLGARPEDHYTSTKAENHRLKERIGDFEYEIQELLKGYKPPIELGALGAKRDAFEKDVSAALRERRFFDEPKAAERS